MKEEKIVRQAKEFAILFADVSDDTLMRFVNRNRIACNVFSRQAILLAMAPRPCSYSREQLKSFLGKSVPDALRKKPEWVLGDTLRSAYNKHISCNGACRFDPPLPKATPEHNDEFVENAQEVARRDRALLKKLQEIDEAAIRREILDEAEFNTACANSANARAEAAFRDGVVKAKLAELELFVKEQMADLRRETREYLKSLREEMLTANRVQPQEMCEKIENFGGDR